MTMTIRIRIVDTDDPALNSAVNMPVHATLAAELLLIYTSYIERAKADRISSTDDSEPTLDFAKVIPVLIALGSSQAVKMYGTEQVEEHRKLFVELGMRTG